MLRSLWFLLIASACIAVFVSNGARAGSLPAAIQAGVARSIVDPGVAAALETGARVRVLVTFATDPGRPASFHSDAARARMAGPDFEPGPRLERIPVMAATMGAASLARLLEDPAVLAVGIDPVVEAQLSQAVPLTRLDVRHSGGFTGMGTRVAIIDTGVALDHPDLVRLDRRRSLLL